MRTRIWALLDRWLFGPASDRAGLLGQCRRLLRYPYAVGRDLGRGEINLRAMSLVFTTLLSLIPLLAFSFAILKAFGAHRELQPIVFEFFRPVGASAAQLTERVMQFADRVSSGVAPYAMVTALFTVLYMFIPNTHVRVRPALAGAVIAGIAWAAVGKMFTSMVVSSTRLTMVYAGFAVIVAVLMWTYLGWLIL